MVLYQKLAYHNTSRFQKYMLAYHMFFTELYQYMHVLMFFTSSYMFFTCYFISIRIVLPRFQKLAYHNTSSLQHRDISKCRVMEAASADSMKIVNKTINRKTVPVAASGRNKMANPILGSAGSWWMTAFLLSLVISPSTVLSHGLQGGGGV